MFFFFFRAFVVDKDYAEINALSSIFPESYILLCWYHFLQVDAQVYYTALIFTFCTLRFNVSLTLFFH